MKRRDFLSLCGLAAGSCLVPDAIARAIRDACVLADRPYLILPRDPEDVLYALTSDGKSDFMLHLGDPFEASDPPTWAEYFEEFEGFSFKNKKAVRQWWREHVGDPEDEPITIDPDAEHRSAGALGVDPAHAGPARARRAGASESNLPFGIDPNGIIDGAAFEQWEWRQETHEGPSARAFHLLRDLPLDDGRGERSGSPLGKLHFIEGDHPGSNLTYVEAPDLATLACLQNRLNELGQNLAIEIRKW